MVTQEAGGFFVPEEGADEPFRGLSGLLTAEVAGPLQPLAVLVRIQGGERYDSAPPFQPS